MRSSNRAGGVHGECHGAPLSLEPDRRGSAYARSTARSVWRGHQLGQYRRGMCAGRAIGLQACSAPIGKRGRSALMKFPTFPCLSDGASAVTWAHTGLQSRWAVHRATSAVVAGLSRAREAMLKTCHGEISGPGGMSLPVSTPPYPSGRTRGSWRHGAARTFHPRPRFILDKNSKAVLAHA